MTRATGGGQCPIATDSFYVVDAADVTNIARNVTSMELCCELCANHSNCDGWQWCAGGLFTQDCQAGVLEMTPHTCVLFAVHQGNLTRVDEARLEYVDADSGLVAGTVQVIAAPGTPGYSNAVGFDYADHFEFACDGSAVNNVCMFAGNATSLAATCNATAQCTGFAYFPLGTQGVDEAVGILKAIPPSQGFNATSISLDPSAAIYFQPGLWDPRGATMPPAPAAPEPVDAASIRDHTLLITLTSTLGGMLLIAALGFAVYWWRKRRRRAAAAAAADVESQAKPKDGAALVLARGGPAADAPSTASSSGSPGGITPFSSGPVPADLAPLAQAWSGLPGGALASNRASGSLGAAGSAGVPASLGAAVSVGLPGSAGLDGPAIELGVGPAPLSASAILHSLEHRPVPASSRDLLAELSQRQPPPAAMVDYSVLLAAAGSGDSASSGSAPAQRLGWAEPPAGGAADGPVAEPADLAGEVFQGQEMVLVEQGSVPSLNSIYAAVEAGDRGEGWGRGGGGPASEDVAVDVAVHVEGGAGDDSQPRAFAPASASGSAQLAGALNGPAVCPSDDSSGSGGPEAGRELTPEDVTVCRRPDGTFFQVGAGAFGTVFKGLFRGSMPVAIKVLHHGADERRSREFVREISLLRALRDPHIVRFLGACSSGSMAMLVTEFMDLGDLWKALPLRDDTGERVFAWRRRGVGVALDVARGLCYLHSRKVVHLDLKSANILLSKMGTAKIADVGFSRVLHKSYLSALSGLGTLAWSAPEVLAGRRCSEKADIYSFGVLLWEIVCGEGPVRGQMRAPRVPEESPPEAVLLMATCCAEDPARRPTAQQLVAILENMHRALQPGNGTPAGA